MGRRSKIDQLPAEIREAADAAIANGATVDEVTAAIRAAGEDVSRAAVGRYSQRYSELVKRHRELATVARAWGREADDPEVPLARMMIQIAETDMTAKAMTEAAAFDPDQPVNWNIEELKTRAMKNLAGAGKITADREASIRKNEREKAAAIVASVGKRAGATPETIDQIKRELLGISA